MGEVDKLKQFDIFNTLRVIATMFVFILHAILFVPGISKLHFLAHMPAWAGVWIFFFLSGYLLQKGFNNKKNEEKGFKFYIKWFFKRFLKVGIPYYIYLFIFFIMGNGYIPNWNEFLRLIFFNYDGLSGIDGFKHLWFMSILMQLYVLTPLFNFIIEKIKNKPALIVIMLGLLVGGFLLRFFLFDGGPTIKWHKYMYTPFYANLDIYVSAMICSYLSFNLKDKFKLKTSALVGFRIFAWLAFLVFVVANCWLYGHDRLYAYQVYFPTIYILFCILFAYLYDHNKTESDQNKNSKFAKMLNIFSGYSFYFYFFHISSFMFVKNWMLQLKFYAQMPGLCKYLLFMILSFAISIALAYLFDKMMKCLQKRKN